MELISSKRRSTKTMCMQLHVDAARWDDGVLAGFLALDGIPMTGPEVRNELFKAKSEGLEVVPCGRHKCDDKGRCQGG